ncbi:MAG: DNA repair protein RecN [Candidatus Sericytochromatia bacterium]|nr:DNA repair protein RecN [Candidatus Tanganyikabacteria bacterium]
MLLRLQVHQYVLIEHLDLEGAPGLTVLTGETGAGKSVLLSALATVLGGRTSSDVIRPGAAKALVEATFAAEGPWWDGWRDAAGIAAIEPGRVVLSREMTAQGSRARIDGQTVTLADLRDLGRNLVAMSGQHDHVRLMDASVQRETLDAHGGHDDLVRQVAAAHARWQALVTEERDRREAAARRETERDFMAFQLAELDAASLVDPDEDVTLRERLQIVRQQARLLEGAGRARQACSEASGGPVSAGVSALRPLAAIDPRLAEALDLLESAQASLDEAADGLRRYADRDREAEKSLEEMEARLHLLSGLARRHGGTLSAAIARRARLAGDLARADEDDEACLRLSAAVDEAGRAWDLAAARLTAARRQSAVRLGEVLSGRLQGLGLPHARVTIDLEPSGQRSAHGAESVTWLFSAQPDAPPRPLAKVASGGELARLLLSVHGAMQGVSALPTLVFDEIDTGISGEAAAAVGRQLARMSEGDQVLVVTHLPAVAAGADRHLHLRKVVVDGRTELSVKDLGDEDRIRVLAEMLAGDEPADGALGAARELRQRARGRGEVGTHGSKA